MSEEDDSKIDKAIRTINLAYFLNNLFLARSMQKHLETLQDKQVLRDKERRAENESKRRTK
jgi:hypothetical protein